MTDQKKTTKKVKTVKDAQDEIEKKVGKEAAKTVKKGSELKSPKKEKTEEVQAPAPKDGEYETVEELLWFIQQNLKAPKGQKNTHGNYNYRSAEDILEAVKKLLPPTALIKLGDEVVLIGDRYYVKATAKLKYKGGVEKEIAYARETEDRKGMDQSQITGATSSYARKYAMNGLFAIDDTKDADTDEQRNETQSRSGNRGRSSYSKKSNNSKPAQKKKARMITANQKRKISELFEEQALEVEEMKNYVLDVYKVDSVGKMTVKQASHFIGWLIEQEPLPEDYGSQDDDIDLDEIDEGIERQRLENGGN